MARTGGYSLLPSFQSRLTETLKARGLIPMSTGVTRPVRVAENYGDAIMSATEEVERARVMFGSRSTERYSTSVGNTYRDKRFAMIASLESVKLRVYQDTKHNVSVGLGFNMDKSGARDVWARAFGDSVSFDAVKSGTKELSYAQAKTLFDNDIAYYEGVVSRAAGDRALTENQRLALVSIAYTSPARVAGWSSVIQSGDDKRLQELILTQSFAAGHPQSEGLQARRYIEASVFSGSAELKSLMPTFGQYMSAVSVDAETGTASVLGRPVADNVEAPKGNLAAFEYAMHGKRDLKVDANLETAIRQSVTAVYGADYKVQVMSGGQGAGSKGTTGTRRHGTMTAADVYIFDPSGKRLTNEQLKPLAQDWLARKVGSVGLPVHGSTNSLHLDLIGGTGPGSSPLQRAANGRMESTFWFYGGEDADMRKTLKAATPPSYALDPAAVLMGYVPPASLPSVGSEVSTAPANPMPASVEAKIIARNRAAAITAATSETHLDTLAMERQASGVKPPVEGIRPPYLRPVPISRNAGIMARTNAIVDAGQAELAAQNELFNSTFPDQNTVASLAMPTLVPDGPLDPVDAIELVRAGVPVDGWAAAPAPTSLAAASAVNAATARPVSGAGTMGVSAPRAVVPMTRNGFTVLPSGRTVSPTGTIYSRSPVYGVTATGYQGDFGSSPRQSTSGLKPGDRVYNADTNSWELK